MHILDVGTYIKQELEGEKIIKIFKKILFIYEIENGVKHYLHIVDHKINLHE